MSRDDALSVTDLQAKLKEETTMKKLYALIKRVDIIDSTIESEEAINNAKFTEIVQQIKEIQKKEKKEEELLGETNEEMAGSEGLKMSLKVNELENEN